ncbi:hypothetical protein BD560DRAFT_447238 [Blakeslea trispora]|nr:hypothetical protein BD560DRAFT_447238 [Blakeslea trispora]
MQFLPTENLLQEKPYVKAMLDKLECSLRQFLVEHPVEDEEEMRRMAIGKLSLPHLNNFKTKFARIPVKEDLPAIWSSYQEITNSPPSSLQALVDQTNAYNAKDKQTLPVKEAILTKALANLRSYSIWLLAEFDVHMMHVYAIDDAKADDRFLCYSNSGKMFESRIGEKLVVPPGKYVHKLVMATGAKTRAYLLGLPSPSTLVSSAPVSSASSVSAPSPVSSAPVSVSAFSACQINPTSSSQHAGRFLAVPWVNLLSGETGCLQLRNWPRFKGDVSKTGTYRLQNLSVRHLNDIKDRLDADSKWRKVWFVLILTCISHLNLPAIPLAKVNKPSTNLCFCMITGTTDASPEDALQPNALQPDALQPDALQPDALILQAIHGWRSFQACSPQSVLAYNM